MIRDSGKEVKRQQAQQQSAQIEARLFGQFQTMLKVLAQLLDRRLVATFSGLVLAIISHRHLD